MVIKVINTIPFSSIINHPRRILVMKNTNFVIKVTLHDRSSVSFCIEIKLVDNFGIWRIFLRSMDKLI